MYINVQILENMKLKQFGPVSTCLCPKYIEFCFQNLRNGREDKNGRR